jgi:hypothetical protein
MNVEGSKYLTLLYADDQVILINSEKEIQRE